MKEQMASQNSDQIRDDDLETKISSNEECVSLSKPSGLRFFFLKNPGPFMYAGTRIGTTTTHPTARNLARNS